MGFLQGGLGGAQAFANSETLVSLLKKQRESNKYYGAICASPALVLEPHGLLKVYTLFWFMWRKNSPISFILNFKFFFWGNDIGPTDEK